MAVQSGSEPHPNASEKPAAAALAPSSHNLSLALNSTDQLLPVGIGLGRHHGGACQRPGAEDAKLLVAREQGAAEQEALSIVARRREHQQTKTDEAAHQRLDDDGKGRKGSRQGLEGLGQGLRGEAVKKVRFCQIE